VEDLATDSDLGCLDYPQNLARIGLSYYVRVLAEPS
jgi:hypothetical protein